MERGIIKTVKADKGFGFIEAPGGPDVFFHVSTIDGLDWGEQLQGQRVEFQVETDRRTGKLRAAFVKPAKD
jgi:CspA family cold shock protein